MNQEARRARAPHEVEYGELPELTRGLRALGSARAGSAALQSLFFLPLMEGRRRAAEARSAVACVRAFDSANLARSLDRCIDRMLAGWSDTRPAARRALRARLVERVSDYSAAVERLGVEATAVLGASEEQRLDAWRAWTAALAATFAAADRCWLQLSPALAKVAEKGRPPV